MGKRVMQQRKKPIQKRKLSASKKGSKRSKRQYSEVPDPKRAQLWMGYEYEMFSSPNDRFRVLYPDGTSCWADSASLKDAVPEWRWGCRPCWQTYRRQSMEERQKAMAKYDAMWDRKTIFLGNL